MGEIGREVVQADFEELLQDLQSAYADEWLAHYQYWVSAQWMRGIDADALKSVLMAQSLDELGHAQRIAARIIQLGGNPVMEFADLVKASSCGLTLPPEDPTDLKQIVQNVIDAERCAIRQYNKLAIKYRASDLVTHELFEDLLKDEVDEEQLWEDYLPGL
ncbi:MAG: ferritin-like domain-containing protein [Thermoplasmata archaeon]